MSLLFLQQWFSDHILKAIGWTLIHSLWQGLLAAVLAGIIIISTRKSVARLRYNLLGIVLVLSVITTIITFSQLLKGNAVPESPFIHEIVLSTDKVAALDIADTSRAADITTMAKFAAFVDRNAGLLVMVWLLFFFTHCMKLVVGLAGIQRMRNYKAHKSPGEWASRLDQLSKIVGIKRTVTLLQSGLVKVPVAIGFFKPVILVPLGLLSHLPPEQVETILLHELAHIRRNDYVINILQRIAEAVFFFNPAFLWISSLARQEREACCDDIVIANTTDKGSYLEALVAFQEYSFSSAGYAMAISSNRFYLLNRVKRMITRENKKLNNMEKIILTIGVIAVTAFTFIPKKETVNKKDVAVIQPREVSGQKPTEQVQPAMTASNRKPVTRKEQKKPAPETLVNELLKDTVPPSKKEKDKTSYEDLKFPSTSSTTNDDGKNKTQTTTVTDQDGKKYSYTKLNNKVTSLTIDGKKIPENEFGNYSELFDRIERTFEENKVTRLIAMESRRAERETKAADFKNRLVEKRILQQEFQEKQRQGRLEQNLLNEEYKRSRKSLENQRKEAIRLLQKLKENRRLVPMLNGREVIKNDVHAEKPNIAYPPVKIDINYAMTKPQKKELKIQPDIALKLELHTDKQDNLWKDFDYDARVKTDLNYQSHDQNLIKPVAPVKVSVNVKPVSPGTLKPKMLPLKRRIVS